MAHSVASLMSSMGDDDDIWNDPKLLNNPEKLMRIKWTPKDLQLAASTNFVEKINFTTECILQDSNRLKEAFKNHRIRTSEDAAVGTMNNVIQRLNTEQEKCIQLYVACKGKPFWVPEKQVGLVRPEQEEKVTKRWTEVLDKFSASFEKVQQLRNSRRSILGSEEEDAETEEIIEQFKNIYQELTAISKVLDCVKPEK